MRIFFQNMHFSRANDPSALKGADIEYFGFQKCYQNILLVDFQFAFQ